MQNDGLATGGTDLFDHRLAATIVEVSNAQAEPTPDAPPVTMATLLLPCP
jgi:hypothetical protein